MYGCFLILGSPKMTMCLTATEWGPPISHPNHCQCYFLCVTGWVLFVVLWLSLLENGLDALFVSLISLVLPCWFVSSDLLVLV